VITEPETTAKLPIVATGGYVPTELDRVRALNAELLAALRDFVALYDGTRDMLGTSVLGKLQRADAAIAKAEGR